MLSSIDASPWKLAYKYTYYNNDRFYGIHEYNRKRCDYIINHWQVNVKQEIYNRLSSIIFVFNEFILYNITNK